jgi:leader peptidase (prepilin peptidase) / N-methyltransferase
VLPPLWVLIVGCALFGLAIGSFLNVVIVRVPDHESIVSPPSSCPYCHTPIAVRDNIPVVSWLLLRGRCRTCQATISVRYPLVELASAALFAGTAARFGYVWELPAYLALFAGLLALSWIDCEHLLLPRTIVYPLGLIVAVLLVVASAATDKWHSLLVGALSAVVWFVLFFLLNLFSPRLLGFGDVRLALVLGLSLGWLGVGYVLFGFVAGNFVGAVIGLALIAAKQIDRQQQIPYGVFLAAGAGIAVFAGPEVLNWLHHS